MPKYKPTHEDLYSTKPCFICGRDVIEEGAETCSDLCQQQLEIFKESWELFQWKNFEDEPVIHIGFPETS